MEKEEYNGRFKQKYTNDPYHCKCCQKFFKSLLKHLGQQPKCKLEYSDKEFDNLKAQMKSISDTKEKSRKTEYYKTNRDSLLEKRAIYAEKNNSKIHEQRQSVETQLKKKEYYQNNKEMLARNRDLQLHATVNQKDPNTQVNASVDAGIKPSYNCIQCSRIFKVEAYFLDHVNENHPNYPDSALTEVQLAILEGSTSREEEYYNKNREHILKQKAKRYETEKKWMLDRNNVSYWNNRESYTKTRANYYQKNKEKLLSSSKENYKNNNEKISSKRKEDYHQDKKKFYEDKAKSDLEEAIEVRLKFFNEHEIKARNINRVEGEFFKDTRLKLIKRLKSKSLSKGDKQKLINFEKIITDKYKLFEKEIDAIMIDVKDFQKETFETIEEMYNREMIINRKFHQLYKAIYRKDEPESPDRILKEWKQVQNEVDKELIRISLKYNELPSYSPKCYSHSHIVDSLLKDYYCKDKDLETIRKEWTNYMEDEEYEAAKTSEIGRFYVSDYYKYGKHCKRNPVKF